MGDVSWISIEDALVNFWATPESISSLVQAGDLNIRYERRSAKEFLLLMDHQLARYFERRRTKGELAEEGKHFARGVIAGLGSALLYEFSKSELSDINSTKPETTNLASIRKHSTDILIFYERMPVWQRFGDMGDDLFHNLDGHLKNFQIYRFADEKVLHIYLATLKRRYENNQILAFIDMGNGGGASIQVIRQLRSDAKAIFIVGYGSVSDRERINEYYACGINL